MKKIAIILFALTTACAVHQRKAADNRAVTFAQWKLPGVRCTALVTLPDASKADTALCEIGGAQFWCVSSADAAPRCEAYNQPGAPAPQPAMPAPTDNPPAAAPPPAK